MKIRLLAVSLIGLSLLGNALADDLPSIGYSERTPVKDLAAKGYRWVTVDGPYGLRQRAGSPEHRQPAH